MVLYDDGYTEISTISEDDKQAVLKLYSENDFGCDAETGALRPTDSQFLEIMDRIISKKDDERNVFVLKEQGKLIGYASCFVEYDRLTIGHIAIDKPARGRGYGTALTQFIIYIAENEGRDVNLFCLHPNSCFKKMGFETHDSVHYLHKSKGEKTEGLPVLFVSKEEYKKRRIEKREKEVADFAKFLNSGFLDMLGD